MMGSIQNSVRHSLAAVTFAAMLGIGNADATAAISGDPSPVQKEDGAKKESDERAAAAAELKERLVRIGREIEELREAGKNEAAEKLANEAREIKIHLAKLMADKDDRKIKESKEQAEKAELQEKRALEAVNEAKRRHKELLASDEKALKEKVVSEKYAELLEKLHAARQPKKGDGEKGLERVLDELHARLKMLEAENAKLRDALGTGKEKKDPEKHEAVHKQHEALKKLYEDAHKQQIEAARHMEEHARKMLLNKEDAAMAAAREKLEHLAKMAEKNSDPADAAKIHDEMARLRRHMGEMHEKAARSIATHPEKWPESHAATLELGAVIKELRHEVGRLREEVADLRRIVGDRGEERKKKIEQ